MLATSMRDLRETFDDFITSDETYEGHVHNYEYRLGLAQEKTQRVNMAYRAAAGEYVGERQWTYDEDRIPLAEVAYRKARDLSAEWPWDALLDDELNTELAAYREVLKRWASRL